jgi:hypothetical protein
MSLFVSVNDYLFACDCHQIFVQGLVLPEEPYVFFCREGIKMLLKLATPAQLVACLPRLFDPIIAALSAEGNDDVVAGGMTIIQQLLLSDPEVAAALVPYYARFVPVFNKYKKKQSTSPCSSILVVVSRRASGILHT